MATTTGGNADTGGREFERITGLEATHQIQDAVANFPQMQGTGASGADERHESKALVGKTAVPERLANKTSFKQWSRRCKLVAGAKHERFKVFEWAEGDAIRAAPLRQPAQEHRGKNGSALHCRQYSRGKCGGDSSKGSTRRRRLQNLNLMSKILKPPEGKTEHNSFFTDSWGKGTATR